eukprot:2650939-Rhodomonas_salina.2
MDSWTYTPSMPHRASRVPHSLTTHTFQTSLGMKHLHITPGAGPWHPGLGSRRSAAALERDTDSEGAGAPRLG